jgi:thiol-disulfide isomerase/thioredoxin
MRIDPKYFNRFIAICALITVIVIIYSTIRYSQRQVTDFENNVSEILPDTLSFRSFSVQDSLHLNEIENRPVIIHFWSTWSDKSIEVGEFLNNYSADHESLVVIAAAVRDGAELVEEYIAEHPRQFYFVEGTEIYQSLLAPGMPTQIFITREKEIFDIHVGDDTTEIEKKLNRLLADE